MTNEPSEMLLHCSGDKVTAALARIRCILQLFSTGNKTRFFLLSLVLLAALAGCASLMDGKFVTKDGKESPFKQKPDRYEVPSDPTARY